MKEQVVGVVGLGPVGTILAAYLAKAGVRVYAVETVETRAEQVGRDGLHLRGFTELSAGDISDQELKLQLYHFFDPVVNNRASARKGDRHEP